MAADKYTFFTPAETPHGTGSTDYGDVSYLKPLIQFGTGGFTGMMHNPDVAVVDEYLAYVVPAKIFALSAYKFLKDDAKRAKEHIAGYKPQMNKEQYVEFMESCWSRKRSRKLPCPSWKTNHSAGGAISPRRPLVPDPHIPKRRCRGALCRTLHSHEPCYRRLVFSHGGQPKRRALHRPGA